MFKVDFDLVKKAQKILDDNSELFEKSLCSIDALASINYNLSTQIYEINSDVELGECFEIYPNLYFHITTPIELKKYLLEAQPEFCHRYGNTYRKIVNYLIAELKKEYRNGKKISRN